MQEIRVRNGRNQLQLHHCALASPGDAVRQLLVVIQQWGEFGVVRRLVLFERCLQRHVFGVDGVIVNDVQQSPVGVAAVDDALQLILIEGDIHPLFVALLPDTDRRRGADHAAVENLEQLGASEQSLAHLAAGGVLDNVRNAGVRVERQVPWKVSCGNDEHPFLAGAVVEGFEGPTAAEAVGLERGRTDGVASHDIRSCAALPRRSFVGSAAGPNGNTGSRRETRID